MLTPDQLKELANKAVTAIKAVNSLTTTHKKDYDDLPNYNPIYRDAVIMADEVAVHATLKDFPKLLFRSKVPSETKEEMDYREISYQPETMPLWNKALGATNGIFNDQNWSIVWTDKEQQKYFDLLYPQYRSFQTYLETVIRTQTINDPNGVIVIKPNEIPTISDGENTIVDDTALLRPVVITYPSKQVIDFKEDKYCVILLNEKSDVQAASQKKKEGLIFEIYDDHNIYRLTQYGDKDKYLFNTVAYFNEQTGHELINEDGIKILPAWKLRGIPIQHEDYILNKSYLYDAVPLLNQALFDASTLEVCKRRTAYPITVMYEDPCDNSACQNGYIPGDNGTYDVLCPSCKGSGHKTRLGPMRTYFHRSPTKFTDGDTGLAFPGITFVSPDPAILQFLRDEIKYNKNTAFDFVGLEMINEKATPETATGKIIDQNAFWRFLLQLSKDMFDIMEFCIHTIGLMRYGKAFVMPTINRPNTFVIRTNDEILTELSEALKSNVPEIIIRKLVSEYLQIRFSSNKDITELLEVVYSVDTLASFSRMDILAGIGAGTIAKWQDILHTHIYQFIDEKMTTNPEYLSLDDSVIRTELEAMAKELETAMQSDFSATSILNKMANGGTGGAA